MSRLQDRLDAAAEVATDLSNLMFRQDRLGRTVQSRLIDSAEGQPGAQRTDRVGSGSTTVMWCDSHNQRAEVCQATCREHGEKLDTCRMLGLGCHKGRWCMGRPLAPKVDPTGDAALSHDPARQALKDIERLVGHAVQALRSAEKLARPWAAREASDAERQHPSTRNPVGCQSCSRYQRVKGQPFWSPVHPTLKGPTDVGGRLGRPMRLCRRCYDHVWQKGCLPNLKELRAYADPALVLSCPHKDADPPVVEPAPVAPKAKRARPAKTKAKAEPKTPTGAGRSST